MSSCIMPSQSRNGKFFVGKLTHSLVMALSLALAFHGDQKTFILHWVDYTSDSSIESVNDFVLKTDELRLPLAIINALWRKC